MIHTNQIAAADEIVAKFEKTRSLTLIAEMQSGKTHTFLLTAFESLRQRLCRRVFIISGNNDAALKKQTLAAVEKFENAYFEFLLYRDIYITIDEYHALKHAIIVKWSADLSKDIKKDKLQKVHNTLVIWEEAHFAQSRDMLPFQFLSLIGVCVDGNDPMLANKNNLMLTVSATPFSEFASIVTQKQKKDIVLLKPGAKYRGVGSFLANGQIHSHTNQLFEFEAALETATATATAPKYAIVRSLTEELTNQFCETAETKGWRCAFYNQETRDLDISLKVAPTHNTVVFIKGALRMGQQVSKKHIAFCWESTREAHTDTILQGLLGRMCSYDNTNNILIYIHKHIVESGELQRYVAFISGFSQADEAHNCVLRDMPTTAMNVSSSLRTSYSPVVETNEQGTTEVHKPCVPIFIKLDTLTKAGAAGDLFPSAEALCLVLNNPELEKRVQREGFAKHKCSAKSYGAKVAKLVAAWTSNKPFRSSRDPQVHVWAVDATLPAHPDLQPGDLFVEYSVTDKLEFFCNVFVSPNASFYKAAEAAAAPTDGSSQ
jgi:hypothetical protein